MPDRNAFAPGQATAPAQGPISAPSSVTPEPKARKFNIGRILRGLGGALDATGQTNRLNFAFMQAEKEERREEEDRLIEEQLRERERQNEQEDTTVKFLVDLVSMEGVPLEDRQNAAESLRLNHNINVTAPTFEEDETEPFTLAPGAVRFDAEGNKIAEAPTKQDTGLPEGFEVVEGEVRLIPGFAKATEKLAEAKDVGEAKTKAAKFENFVDKDNNPVTIDTSTPEGVAEAKALIRLGGQKGKPTVAKEPTAAQGLVAGFAVRMEQSGAVIDEIGHLFTGFTSRIGQSDLVPEGAKSDDRQRFEQAKRNWINADLRRESGAVISQQEFDNADLQYFPVPGNGDAVLIQKAQNRKTVIAAFKTEAGPAYDKLVSELPPTTIKINGKDVIVGSRVTGKDGRTGILLQDGSVEVD